VKMIFCQQMTADPSDSTTSTRSAYPTTVPISTGQEFETVVPSTREQPSPLPVDESLTFHNTEDSIVCDEDIPTFTPINEYGFVCIIKCSVAIDQTCYKQIMVS